MLDAFLTVHICSAAAVDIIEQPQPTGAPDNLADLVRLLEQDPDPWAGLYWPLTYTASCEPPATSCEPPAPPSEEQQQHPHEIPVMMSCDTVDVKLPCPPAPVMLFVNTYNLTASGSKRLNIGIGVPQDVDTEEWCVVYELENVKNGVKIRFGYWQWEEMCRAETYIDAWMNDDLTSKPRDVHCAGISLSICMSWDDVALVIQTGDKSIYLKYPTVRNLFCLRDVIDIASERLERWLPCVRDTYRDVAGHIQKCGTHVSDLERIMRDIPMPKLVNTPLSYHEMRAEFTAYRVVLFKRYCGLVRMIPESRGEVVHPEDDI